MISIVSDRKRKPLAPFQTPRLAYTHMGGGTVEISLSVAREDGSTERFTIYIPQTQLDELNNWVANVKQTKAGDF